MNTIKMKSNHYKGKIPKLRVAMFAMAVLLASCEINDPVLNIAAPGHVAASIYWDIPVTNVTAGNEVAFYAEYWSVDDVYEYLGVWYDISKTMNFTLTHPGSGYSFTLDSAELSREFLEMKKFTHSEASYDAEKKAYIIEDQFPVSYTLSSLEYKNPIALNQEQFDQLVPPVVKTQFRNNLFPLLTYQDWRNMLVTEHQLIEAEVFETYFDTIDVEGVITREMKTDAEPVLQAHFSEVPFGTLIYNRNRQFYAVEITQGFELNARFKIINGNNVENFSEAKRITVF